MIEGACLMKVKLDGKSGRRRGRYLTLAIAMVRNGGHEATNVFHTAGAGMKVPTAGRTLRAQGKAWQGSDGDDSRVSGAEEAA